MPLLQKLNQSWEIEIPYSELAEFKLFSQYVYYLNSQFDYPIEMIEEVKFYKICFQEEREANRAMALFTVFKNNIKLDNTITRKLNEKEFVAFHEWCYTNIKSGWLIFEYNTLLNLQWIEVPIFVESMEEMVLLKLKWC